MAEGWIGVVGALGGVIVGGVAESFRSRVTFRRERSWDLYPEEQRRIEEIYVALEQVRESYRSSLGPILVALTTEHRVPSRDSIPVPWARLRMLVYMYAPYLTTQLAAVEAAGPKLGEMMAKGITERTQDRARNTRLGDSIMHANDALNSALDQMRDVLVDKSRSLAKSAKSKAGYPVADDGPASR